MISDSVPWKDELLRTADRLEARVGQRRWTERTSFLVERDVMLGAYAVRKLLDTPGKVSDEARGSAVSVQLHPLTRTAPPDFWSAYKFWEHYDVEGGRAALLPLRGLCNQVIHSLVFSLTAFENGEGLEGFFVPSDRQSRNALIFVPIPRLVDAFRTVGRDDVVHLVMSRDEAGVMHVNRASRNHPPRVGGA